MFNFLKGTKVDLSLELNHSNLVYTPGDTAQVHISLENDKELKIQRGVLKVWRAERYTCRVEERDTDDDGHTSTRMVDDYHTIIHDILDTEFLPESVLAPGGRAFDAGFSLAPTAPPTASGTIVEVAYYAKATLDRKLASDYNSQVGFQVLSQPPQAFSPAGDYGASSHPNDAGVSLCLAGKEFTDQVIGSVKIMPHKSFKVKEVRLELLVHEYVPSLSGYSYSNEKNYNLGKFKVAGDTQLDAGLAVELPFVWDLPDNLLPSFDFDNGSFIHYKLKAILNRWMSFDISAEEDVLIYTS